MCASNGSSKLRILIADDEKTIADTLNLILTQVGYDVSVVYDGLSAVEMAKEWSPDLFLSDIYMPGISGIDAAIQVCELLPHCKVLLFTGQGDLQEIHDEIKAKCRRFDVFSKPIHPTELISRIREIE